MFVFMEQSLKGKEISVIKPKIILTVETAIFTI